MTASGHILQEVRIVRTLDEVDGETFTCVFQDCTSGGMIPLLDGLGLLEAAKIDLMQQHAMIPMPPGQAGNADADP